MCFEGIMNFFRSNIYTPQRPLYTTSGELNGYSDEETPPPPQVRTHRADTNPLFEPNINYMDLEMENDIGLDISQNQENIRQGERPVRSLQIGGLRRPFSTSKRRSEPSIGPVTANSRMPSLVARPLKKGSIVYASSVPRDDYFPLTAPGWAKHTESYNTNDN